MNIRPAEILRPLRRNSRETVSQNYRRLGLTVKLNHATGGTEKLPFTENSSNAPAPGRPNRSSLAARAALPSTASLSEVRVERDPTTGAIRQIIDQQPAKPNPLGDPLNDIVDSDAESWDGFDNQPIADSGANKRSSKSSVVAQLIEQAAGGVRKPPRRQSEHEKAWLAALAAKHGDNYGAMFRDMKMNVMQLSEGDIKRRIRRWREAQGPERHD